jgi:hypothetical protein
MRTAYISAQEAALITATIMYNLLNVEGLRCWQLHHRYSGIIATPPSISYESLK